MTRRCWPAFLIVFAAGMVFLLTPVDSIELSITFQGVPLSDQESSLQTAKVQFNNEDEMRSVCGRLCTANNLTHFDCLRLYERLQKSWKSESQLPNSSTSAPPASTPGTLTQPRSVSISLGGKSLQINEGTSSESILQGVANLCSEWQHFWQSATNATIPKECAFVNRFAVGRYNTCPDTWSSDSTNKLNTALCANYDQIRSHLHSTVGDEASLFKRLVANTCGSEELLPEPRQSAPKRTSIQDAVMYVISMGNLSNSADATISSARLRSFREASQAAGLSVLHVPGVRGPELDIETLVSIAFCLPLLPPHAHLTTSCAVV